MHVPVRRWFHARALLFLTLLFHTLGTGVTLEAADAATLRIYWTDVEGGAATLIVTPTGETVLIDTGLPGERDPGRIVRTMRHAGAERIDHLVVTHFDSDHYGGAADLARLVPIGRVYDPGLPRNPGTRLGRGLVPYLEAVADRRTVIVPGGRLRLRDADAAGTTALSIRCLASNQEFLTASPEHSGETPQSCARHEPQGKDTTENANSVVLLLEFGPFRFLDAADLTWDLEKRLVCPDNLVGQVDVFQVDHHGLAVSNNPVLVEAIAPRVAIINNGHRKGAASRTLATLRAVPTVEAIYQLHRNLGVDDSVNTVAHRIANEPQACAAEIVALEVAPDGKRYTVSVPSKQTAETYSVWP